MDHGNIRAAAAHYEALLGVGRTSDASSKLDHMIRRLHDAEMIKHGHFSEGTYDAEMFGAFIKRACRVRNADAMTDLLTRAAQYLPPEEMDKLKGLCPDIPPA
jgi:hypothetical protein